MYILEKSMYIYIYMYIAAILSRSFLKGNCELLDLNGALGHLTIIAWFRGASG